MALSPSVQEALNEAQSNLRNALAYAARNERPIVCNSISKLLTEIETIEQYDRLFDSMENGNNNNDNPFNKFFN